MKFIDTIFSLVWDISQWFYEAYLEVGGWIFPFGNLAYALYYVHRAFWSLLTPLAQFYDWAYDVTNKVTAILDEGDIWLAFGQWFKWAEWSWNWVRDAWLNVAQIVDDWWRQVSLTVQVWVAEAKNFAQSLFNNLQTWLGSLQTSWDNFWTLTWPQWTASLTDIRASWDSFWTTTFPTLATWSGVRTLVDSTIKSWFPFYDELVSLWGEIREFFTDPSQYVYNKLDDFFERFW